MEYNLLIANYKKYSKRETEINQEITQIKVKIEKINEQIISFGVISLLNGVFDQNLQTDLQTNVEIDLQNDNELTKLKRKKHELLTKIKKLEKQKNNQGYLVKIDKNPEIYPPFIFYKVMGK